MKIPIRRGWGARRLSNGTIHLSSQLLNFADMMNDKHRCRKTESTQFSSGAAIYKLGSTSFICQEEEFQLNRFECTMQLSCI